MKKKIIVITSIIAMVIGAYFALRAVFSDPADAYTKEVVMRGDVEEIVSVTGTVIPAKEIDLQFETSGSISQINTSVGSFAKVGDVLMRIYAGELSAQYQSYAAALDIAQAKLAQTVQGTRSEEVGVYQAALESAQASLVGKQQALVDAQAEANNDLAAAYEDATDALNISFTKADQAINIVYKAIREDEFNGSGNLATNVRSREDIARAELEVAESFLNTAAVDEDGSDIDKAIEYMKTALQSARNALTYLRSAMDDPTVAYSISAADKTSVDTERATIDAQLTSLLTAQQAIISTKLANDTSVNAAQSNLEAATAALAKAENELLLKQAGPTQADIDLAKAQVAQAQANLRQIGEKISKTALISPVNGLVTNIEKEVGEMAQANATILSMIGTGNFQIETNISETEIAKININDPITMTLDALGPEEVFIGRVIRIDPAETVVSGVIYYRVTAVFDAEDDRIKSGMTVNLDILTDMREDVLTLPFYAIRRINGNKVVDILEKGEVIEKKIQTGLEGETVIEITSGLNENDEVLIKN